LRHISIDNDMVDAVNSAVSWLASFIEAPPPASKSTYAPAPPAHRYSAIGNSCPASRTMHASTLMRLAGLSGAMAIGLGAYGAHVMRNDPSLNIQRKTAFDTANRYHLVHTVALLASTRAKYPLVTGSLFVAGMLLFSGTCYHYSLTGQEQLRQFTPFGGILLIVAWLSLVM